MATGNFYNRNANYIYAICMNYQDEETEETLYPESWEYEEAIDYVRERIEDTELSVWDSGQVSNRDTSGVCCVELTDNYYGLDIEVYTTVVSRSGYYEGANIDWEDVEVRIDGVEQYEEISLEYTDLNAGLQAIAHTNVSNRVYDLKEKLEKILNDTLKASTEVYGVSARFSNGETIYHKVA